MLYTKEGMCVAGLRPENLFAIMVATEVFASFGYDCILTSVTDGKHMPGSLHYVGLASDYRIKQICVEEHKKQIADAIRKALTAEYDVLLKATHIHVEFQPKRPLNQ